MSTLLSPTTAYLAGQMWRVWNAVVVVGSLNLSRFVDLRTGVLDVGACGVGQATAERYARSSAGTSLLETGYRGHSHSMPSFFGVFKGTRFLRTWPTYSMASSEQTSQ